jgi:chemosensory pili system protein ChpA (sensor histidine kinase/response regulator)
LERNHSRVQAEEARQEAQRQQAEEAARQEAQRLELERPRQLEQQKLLEEAAKREQIKAAARQVAAEETLKLKRQVDSYFQAAPPNCSDFDLATVEYQHRYCNERLGQAYENYSALDKQVRSANFWQKLLPEYSRNLAQLKDLLDDWQSALTQKQSVEKQLLKLQQTLLRYKEWEQSPQTQSMRQQREYLLSPQVRELVASALEQERIQELVRQQELERQRQHEKTLNQLQQWYLTAQKLKRPSEYLNRIVEIAHEFRAGTPLSEKAIAAMKTDREEEQRQQRGRGLSR